MAEPIKSIVFDCDGVILESVDIKTRAFEHVFAQYGEDAVAEVLDFHRQHGGVNRLKKFAHVFETVFSREMTVKEAETLNIEFTAFCKDGLMECDPVDGFLEVAQRWCNALPCYVASGAPHDELNRILEYKNYSRFFKGIFGAPHNKADIILMAAKQHGIDVSSVLMVGDASTDLEAATTAGSAFYGRGEFANSVAQGKDLHDLNRYLCQLAGG